MNYKQIIEYLKMQQYTEDQIKRAIIFLDNKEYYQVTTEINKEIVEKTIELNKIKNENDLVLYKEKIKELDPIQQLNEGKIDFKNINLLSEKKYDIDLLRNTLGHIIMNIDTNSLTNKINDYMKSIEGTSEIVYVSSMVNNIIPSNKIKDKLMLESISNSIKEYFPNINKNFPNNLIPTIQSNEFLKNIDNSNSPFKKSENYIDLQTILYNIKDDLYSLNGLSNIIITLNNAKNEIKNNIETNQDNSAKKGLYEINELVQVYAANELLTKTNKYVNKSLDVEEAKIILNDIKFDDNLVKVKEDENLNLKKIYTLSYLIAKLNGNENFSYNTNNINSNNIENLKVELENKIKIEENKLKEQRDKNGMIKESSLLSFTLLGLLTEDLFTKYISKEEHDKKISKKNEILREEDNLRYNSNRIENDLDIIKKQKELLGNEYFKIASLEKYQLEMQRINSFKKQLKDFEEVKNLVNKLELSDVLTQDKLFEMSNQFLLDNHHEKFIEPLKSMANGNEEILKVINEQHLKIQKIFEDIENAKVNGNLSLEDREKFMKELSKETNKLIDYMEDKVSIKDKENLLQMKNRIQLSDKSLDQSKLIETGDTTNIINNGKKILDESKSLVKGMDKISNLNKEINLNEVKSLADR